MCQRVLLIENGHLKEVGNPTTVIAGYPKALAATA